MWSVAVTEDVILSAMFESNSDGSSAIGTATVYFDLKYNEENEWQQFVRFEDDNCRNKGGVGDNVSRCRGEVQL